MMSPLGRSRFIWPITVYESAGLRLWPGTFHDFPLLPPLCRSCWAHTRLDPFKERDGRHRPSPRTPTAIKGTPSHMKGHDPFRISEEESICSCIGNSFSLHQGSNLLIRVILLYNQKYLLRND
jgi:hypothetical protein